MDNKVNNANFIAIQGWMVNELNLKGNSLLIYAIIYGFSQTEEQWYNGSRTYLAEWTNSTPQGVSKCLKKMIDDGILVKREHVINNVKFCEYKAVIPELLPVNKVDGVEKEFIGVVNKVDRGSKQSLHNNIEYNIEYNKYSANDDENQKNEDNEKFNPNVAFKKFWETYPRKTNKKKAKDAFIRKCSNEMMFQKMIKALVDQKRSDQWQDVKFIPHASTWINGERWDDEIRPKQEESSSNWMSAYE
ncbi:MAG: helix-turn-helix domain-containing protein [Thomasclavelia sp.]